MFSQRENNHKKTLQKLTVTYGCHRYDILIEDKQTWFKRYIQGYEGRKSFTIFCTWHQWQQQRRFMEGCPNWQLWREIRPRCEIIAFLTHKCKRKKHRWNTHSPLPLLFTFPSPLELPRPLSGSPVTKLWKLIVMEAVILKKKNTNKWEKNSVIRLDHITLRKLNLEKQYPYRN